MREGHGKGVGEVLRRQSEVHFEVHGRAAEDLADRTPAASRRSPIPQPTPASWDPVKGAEAKARTSIVKACTNDCPECYAASVCSTGEPVVSNTEAQLDPFGGIVWCTEAGGATP